MNQFGCVNRTVALFFSLLNTNKLPERQTGKEVVVEERVKDSVVIEVNGEKELERKRTRPKYLEKLKCHANFFFGKLRFSCYIISKIIKPAGLKEREIRSKEERKQRDRDSASTLADPVWIAAY